MGWPIGTADGLGIGLRRGLPRGRAGGALDPRDVPALMAGGIWLPGVGVTSLGGGSRRWASQATATGDDYDLKDSHTGHKPVATTAANGAAVWDLVAGGATAGWSINTGISARPPGAAIQPTSKGSVALWVKANALDTSIHTIFSMWPGGASANRLYFYKNTDNYRLSVFSSNDGSAADTVGGLGVLSRAKWNSGSGPGSGPLTDWTGWHFVRVEIDSSGTNFLLAGGKHSTKIRVFVDEVEYANDEVSGCGQYSAGSAPPSGPVAAFVSGAGRFTVGADFASSQWNGLVGPVYISNEDSAAAVTAKQWQRVMLFNAPAD